MQIHKRTDEVIRDAIRIIRNQALGMWRYRWLAVSTAWLACIGGWATVYMMPDIYAASARVYVDTDNSLEGYLGGIAAPTDVMSEVNLVVREIVSRPNLADVATKTDLALRAKNDSEFQDLLTELQNNVNVVGNRDGVYTISYHDRDRSKALSVVDTLLTNFVEKSLGADRTDSEQAQQFLRKQIDEYDSRLTQAEDRLATFKRDNGRFLSEQTGDYFSRMQLAERSLQATDSKLNLAVRRRDELLRQIEGEEPVFGIVSTAPSELGGSSTSSKIRALEIELEELRLQYTDRHPRIGQILETIKLLKEQEAIERQQRSETAASRPLQQNPLDLNPVYQNMRIQLTNVEVEIASLRAERDAQRAELSRLQTLVDTIPQVEAELKRLNRDYEVVRAKHQQLLQQLETAVLGQDVSRSIDEVQFRVIDPPFSALEPVGPNRPIALTLVFAVAIGVAVAVVFLANQLNPVLIGGRSITEVLAIPVLASVSRMQFESELRSEHRGILLLQGSALILLLSFVLIVIYAEPGSELMRDLLRRVT